MTSGRTAVPTRDRLDAWAPTSSPATVMEVWSVTAVVILLATLGIDKSRAYRVVPAAVNRYRRWRAG